MEVTTTSTRVGKFEARFYHLVFEEEFARVMHSTHFLTYYLSPEQVKGHFGPINSVMFTPDGKGYASGGEDGYVRVHQVEIQIYSFIIVLWALLNVYLVSV